MSDLVHLLQSLRGPLAVEPAFGRAFAGIVAQHLRGTRFSGADLHAALGVAAPSERAETPAPPTIAVIPIRGVIARHAHSMGASTEDIVRATRAAVNSRHVDAILYVVDSPGGTVGGVPEAADEIHAAGQVKPTMAYVDGLSASAGYWLSAAAREVMASRSADGVGSIGVYTIHQDLSKALEQDGVAVTPISAGKFKLEAAPWEPLTDEAREFLQAQVDEAYGWFTAAVATYRADTPANVRNGYGEGRVLGAKDAKAANLIDRVGTLDDAIARLASKVGKRGGRRAQVERERLALADLSVGV